MKPWKSIVSLALLSSVVLAVSAEDELSRKRVERSASAFPVFELVRFPNDPCVASGSKNGTCYTKEECTNKGGSAGGTCAQGYGTCCVFTANECGQTFRENCTYFENPSTTAANSDCSLRICPCTNNICQLRLDFDNFVIGGPSTDTTITGVILSGHMFGGAGANVAPRGQCNTDTFSVTGQGSGPPVICGTNSNEHMYVDASDACNDLVFQLSNTNPQWSIKITQYDCQFENLAPKGCTQYFFGGSNTIRTYNYNGDHHLADQNQVICIRRESGQCRVCYWATADIDFMVSGMMADIGGNKGSSCCGYGNNGMNTALGYDCAIIPGAMKDANLNTDLADQFCGRSKGLVTNGIDAVAVTICSQLEPFQVRFISDSWEFGAESMANVGKGFQLEYDQDSTNCI